MGNDYEIVDNVVTKFRFKKSKSQLHRTDYHVVLSIVYALSQCTDVRYEELTMLAFNNISEKSVLLTTIAASTVYRAPPSAPVRALLDTGHCRTTLCEAEISGVIVW